MADKKFNIPFSTLAVYSFADYLKLVTGFPVQAKFLKRCIAAGAISLLLEPLRWVEKIFYAGKTAKAEMPEAPVFILGHWRSGTTLLHNLLCQDQQFAYITTYQSVFTNFFFGSRWLLKPIMALLMPPNRPSDGAPLAPDLPQEEGFALCTIHSWFFYNFWYFPRLWKHFYDTAILGNGITEKQRASYKKQYQKLIAQAVYHLQRKGFVSKNPANTASIPMLLEMFPNAKFIYIYRNPFEVYQSTHRFFSAVMRELQLQDISDSEFDEMILALYEGLISDYEAQKYLIPGNNLVEIAYEALLTDPLGQMENCYRQLNLHGFDKARPNFKKYLESQKHQVKREYRMEPQQMQKIMMRLDFAIKKYGYTEVDAGQPV